MTPSKLKTHSKFALPAVALIAVTIYAGCGKNLDESSSSNDIEETGQQVGDVMASIDESGGSNGTLSLRDPALEVRSTFARLAPAELAPSLFESILDQAIPSAHAAACSTAGTFGACTGGTTLTRTFGGCTVGTAVFAGTVGFTWSNNNSCTLGSAGDSITRVPSFTVTGRRSATLTVSKSGTIGQRITWLSGVGINKVFSFTNDGIRRVFTTAAGATLFDLSTTTTSNITITGTTRANRVLSGGSLRVTNNASGVTCDYSPSNVAWSTGCNCATSGSWNGTCSDGRSTSVALTGCGTATLVVGTGTQSISFDRCGT